MKTIRMLFGLFVIVAVVYLGWKVIPVYVSKYQFAEAIDDTARMAAVDGRKTPDEIRAAVIDKAKSFDIPIDPEDVTVTRDGSDVSITAPYTVHVDVPVYPFDLKFEPSTKRQGLSFK